MTPGLVHRIWFFAIDGQPVNILNVVLASFYVLPILLQVCGEGIQSFQFDKASTLMKMDHAQISNVYTERFYIF